MFGYKIVCNTRQITSKYTVRKSWLPFWKRNANITQLYTTCISNPYTILSNPYTILSNTYTILSNYYPIPILYYPIPILYYPIPVLYYPIPILYYPIPILYYPIPILYYIIYVCTDKIQHYMMDEYMKDCEVFNVTKAVHVQCYYQYNEIKPEDETQ